MCDICRHTPCDPRCPHAEPPRVVGTCSVCCGEICEGEEIFSLNDNEAIHADCVQGFTFEELFTLTDIDPSDTFRNIGDGRAILNALEIEQQTARGE